jgi:EAL domain-containing protein (putative c-di-GMP-specific phosphodiesterase class I)
MAPEDGDTVERLMQCADVAMYQAKRQHAGTLRYRSDYDEYDAARLSLVAELRRAIERDELVVHYQPKVEAETGRVCAVEALVRWNHPDRGLLYPDEFLPIAERTGLIEPLTQWVLTRALAETRTWAGIAESLAVSVNVSARDLVRSDFASSVLATLRDVGVEPTRLILEITETALMSDPDRAAGSVAQLNAAGIRVSLDDFGRGQTSLGYLSTLALHELKIDKGFVLGMAASAADAAIVSSVVELGHQLGLVVVAEGVETECDSRRLADLGCDILQGYVFARPAPADDMLAWLEGRAVPHPH